MKFPELIAVVIVSVLCAFSAFAQDVELDDFSVFQHDDEIYLSWVISRGSNCNGISIERSSDNIDFQEIGYISGVCGNPNFAQPFSFIDAHPLENQVNYYRLELGLQGYSDTSSIEFTAVGENGFQIRPNPATDQTRIVFQNKRSEVYDVEIISISGAVIQRISSKANSVPIDVSGYPSGLYFIRLTNTVNQQSSTERLVIGRQ